MWSSYSEDKAPYSVVPSRKAYNKLVNEGRYRDEPHGREYKCKKCDEWLPFDSQFYSPRRMKGYIMMSKVCRVCEKGKC
jgi:hypothetical protein